MKVTDFDFELPEELIATSPLAQRDSSKLLHMDSQGKILDQNFTDILNLVNAGDVMVFNDTKVIPARLYGTRRGAKVEVTLHQQTSSNSWKAFAKPAKKLQLDDEVIFSDNDPELSATIIAKNEGGEVELEFNLSHDELLLSIEKIGEIPLPPYITSKRDVQDIDSSTYQTVFAKEKGAVAAPTAGLHYTNELLSRLENKGVICQHITLHVGAGTFLPVKVEDTKNHKMHSEFYNISQQAADAINHAKKNGKRIIAVGTTSMRSLESATDGDGILRAGSDDTDIFITPGYKFKIVDILQTNFHIPKSTLFMLVSAFSGLDNMRNAYSHATKEKYRFYSYGDACFLEKK